LLNQSAVPIGRERFQSAYPEASGEGKRGLGEKETWGKGDLESGKRKLEVVCSLWFIVKKRGWDNLKFAGYFKYLVIKCLYEQAFKKKAQLNNLRSFPVRY